MKRSFAGFFDKIRDSRKLLAEKGYCLTAIDIEHFRLFNKLYGRKAGDQLIESIWNFLRREAKNEDGLMTAAYMGADNFALLMPDEGGLLERVQNGILEEIGKWSSTVGFAPLLGVYHIDDVSAEPETMYDRATLAFDAQDENGRSHIRRYSAKLEAEAEKEILLLRAIRNALEADEFTFFIQPQCNIANGTIVGGEALARWRKPDGTIIGPGAFVPVLEKNGMIGELDRVIWEKVCAWLGEWRANGYEAVPVSINVSRKDVFSMDVPEYLCALLEKYHLPESLIKVEITESAYAQDNGRICRTVNALRDRGFKVMMDDFGCGYSSLNMLKSIPVDVLKLDMKFLDITENVAEKGVNILESVINMARLLQLPIVVEGVETGEQERYVRSLGCRYTQGFYYYRPLPLEEFEKLLKDRARIDRAGLNYKQVEPLHLREFLDRNFISDGMLNNVMGAAAFYEMHDRQIEITRANEQYLRLVGIEDGQDSSYGNRFWNHVCDDDRTCVYRLFKKTSENRREEGEQGNVHLLRADGSVILVHLRVFFLREKNGYSQFYGSLMDITKLAETLKDRQK